MIISLRDVTTKEIIKIIYNEFFLFTYEYRVKAEYFSLYLLQLFLLVFHYITLIAYTYLSEFVDPYFIMTWDMMS